MFNSMMGSGPTPSLRDDFALAALVLAFLILFPLGKGLGGQLVADVYICKEDHAGFVQRGARCVGTWGHGSGLCATQQWRCRSLQVASGGHTLCHSHPRWWLARCGTQPLPALNSWAAKPFGWIWACAVIISNIPSENATWLSKVSYSNEVCSLAGQWVI